MESLVKILENHTRVVEDGYTKPGNLKYRTYAVSTLRGGVGKSTLAFNIAYELAAERSMLLADLCPQCNMTETLMRDAEREVTILNALQPALLGPAFGEIPSDLSYRVSAYCDPFRRQKKSYLVPGDSQLFAFPSMLYQQLQIASAQGRAPVVRALLESLKGILDKEATEKAVDGIPVGYQSLLLWGHSPGVVRG